MADVVWSPRAVADLEAIGAYHAQATVLTSEEVACSLLAPASPKTMIARNLAISTITLAFVVSGCDSSDPDLAPVAPQVLVEAEAVDLSGFFPGFEGRTEVLFRYVGTVPADCYEFTSYNAGYGFPSNGESKVDVTVEAQATQESCRVEPTELRIDTLAFSLPSAELQVSNFLFRFDRGSEAPIEVPVSIPHE